MIFNGRKKNLTAIKWWLWYKESINMLHGLNRSQYWYLHQWMNSAFHRDHFFYFKYSGARYTSFRYPSENADVWKVRNIWKSFMGSGGL